MRKFRETPRNEIRLAYWLLLPSFIVIGLTVLVPLIMTFIDSLRYYNLLDMSSGMPFVWLRNYAHLLHEQIFWQSLGRTLYFTVVSLCIEIPAGIAIAVLLNSKFHGRWLLRTLIILPWAVPTIVNGAMWRWIFNADYGVLNAVFVRLHIIHAYHSWLGDPNLAINMVILADSWKMIPLVVMLILASLQLVPNDFYEAAAMDGAGQLRSFFSLTLPQLKNAILVILVIRTIDAVKVFDIIYAMTGGGPADSTLPVAYMAYNSTFNQLFISRGAAVAYLIAMVTLIFTILYSRLLRGEEHRV